MAKLVRIGMSGIKFSPCVIRKKALVASNPKL